MFGLTVAWIESLWGSEARHYKLSWKPQDSRQIILTLTAPSHSARSDLERARHSLRIDGFVHFAADKRAWKTRSKRTTWKPLRHVPRNILVLQKPTSGSVFIAPRSTESVSGSGSQGLQMKQGRFGIHPNQKKWLRNRQWIDTALEMYHTRCGWNFYPCTWVSQETVG